MNDLQIYDPRTNVITETNYSYLTDLTGMSSGNLASYRSRGGKIKSLNVYIMKPDTTVKDRRSWYEKEKYENEVWKLIIGSNDEFLVSNYGRFKRVRKTKDVLLLPYKNKRGGFMQVKVRFKGKYGDHKIAKIVALHFVGTPKDNQVVRHKNGIITDNYHANLEYVTKKELGTLTGYKAKSKPVVQLDLKTMEPINEFRSAREAGRKCFVSYQMVLDSCKEKYKHNFGFRFMFLNEYEEEILNG